MFNKICLILLLGINLIAITAYAECHKADLAVQVLGSGGPIADDSRASSGYLIWSKNKSIALIDVGGGVFHRFGEAKAKIVDLQLIGITHFHTDHVADFPALLKSGFFINRKESLLVSGPAGGSRFPGLLEFMDALFNPKSGAFRYLSGYLSGKGGLFKAELLEIDNKSEQPTSVLKQEGLKVSSVGVNHWAIPTVGYLVEIGGRRIAFSGDQNGDNPAFLKLIQDADILFMAHAVPEKADPVAGRLHARPSVIGKLAKETNVKRLVLSHFMKRSLDTLDENIKIIKASYSGSVELAEDLKCFNLD
ncbi:MBL fold metallo-hydrolase [Spartinivicinus poritis]|uniref:MBL fold metallo-hydrolase n=1 Tax=Spartinivicinus poritis TaxID=2994640 RepID=A0ABT5U697_9GAMM|nr:MBL fold metallo-hydrolase [Spartinivicinus sp. A2-2]MDE1461898.1 MBL fold metallo-hydrolase [Spartinivicinus sp. A2-2]